MQESAFESPLIPPLALAAYIACIAGVSALVNCAVATALLKHSRNGLFSIIIQLTINDIILLGTSIAPELWTYNAKTWHFSNSGCVAYQGLNVFTSTASLYLIITLSFHTLASINIEESAKKKRNDTEDDEEMRSSRHSLVATSDSSTPPRTMNIDYRLKDTRVPVTFPIVFVWILSASLSVPEFALATTASLHGVVLCGIIQSNHRMNMHLMLGVFNLILPTVMMSTACVLIIIKLKTKKKLLQITNLELLAALQLSLGLIIIYVVLCVPRTIFTVYRDYWISLCENDKCLDLIPQDTITTALSLASSSGYLIATLVRPSLCIFILPCLRKIFLFRNINASV